MGTPDEHRFLVAGTIPVLKVHYEPRPVPAVVVLHGLTASADGQLAELVSLAQAGFAATAVDAPHHGRRRDGWLESLGVEGGLATHARFPTRLT